MKLPNKIFGIDTEEAYKRYLEEDKKPKKQKSVTRDAPSLDGYVYVPNINLYVAKEKTLHNKNWYDTHKELQKQNLQMLTIPQFIEFLKYLQNNPTNENTQIYNEIIEVKGDWRSEWLDAYFEQRDNGMYVLTQNKTNTEKLEDYLAEDKTPGIDLNYWLKNATTQGLPTKNVPKGSLYYWCPRDGNVARFGAGSDRVVLNCGRFPEDSDSSLGVRPTRAK